MVIYDLTCEKNHSFEGWFPSFESFQDQAAKGQISCPVCGIHEVERKPHACAVVKKRDATEERAEKPKRPKARKVPMSDAEARETLFRLHHYVQENFEDVGPNFAKEARAMFHGESEERSIYGTSAPQEREKLDEEGIPYVTLPKPNLDS